MRLRRRHERLSLPAGMELVVPPPTREDLQMTPQGVPFRRSVERASFPPFVYRGKRRGLRVAETG